jgi:hypothetical protein
VSKIINIPSSLPYPMVLPFSEVPELKNRFCYIIKAYPLTGISLTILRDNGMVMIRFADFLGNELDIENPIYKSASYMAMLMQNVNRIITTMKYIGIPKAMFYFSIDKDNPRLIDMRLGINKFCGPGYLNDFFGKQGVLTQEVVGSPMVLDENNVKLLLSGSGEYVDRNFILKSSAFKTIIRGDNIVPLYGLIKHEIVNNKGNSNDNDVCGQTSGVKSGKTLAKGDKKFQKAGQRYNPRSETK